MIGTRAVQKSLLYASVQPWEIFREFEENGQYLQRLAFLEELKTLPFGSVWDFFCLTNDVPVGYSWIREIEKYEKEVLRNRS